MSSGLFTSSSFLRKIYRLFIPYTLVCLLLGWRLPWPQHAEKWITGQLSPPFYFVIVLFQLYILYPLLTKVKHFRFFLPACLVISVVAELFEILTVFNASLCFRYLFFFAYGLKLKDWNEGGQASTASKKKDPFQTIFWSLLMISFIFIVFHEKVYLWNTRYFYAPALLFFILRFSRKFSFGALSWIGRKSLWIFLLHFPISLHLYRQISPEIHGSYETVFTLFALTTFLAIFTAIIVDMVYKFICEKLGIELYRTGSTPKAK